MAVTLIPARNTIEVQMGDRDEVVGTWVRDRKGAGPALAEVLQVQWERRLSCFETISTPA